MSLSGGFKERKSFLTEQSITVFPSFAFSLCMSFISPGIPLSFPCESLIPTFLYILIIFEKSIVIMFFALFLNFFDYIFISQFSHLSIPGKSTFFSVPQNHIPEAGGVLAEHDEGHKDCQEAGLRAVFQEGREDEGGGDKDRS